MYTEFEQIYIENAPIVYLFLIKLGCPQCSAEDIMQDTFVKALINIDHFQEKCKLSTWLCQIAKNTWYTEARKAKAASLDETIRLSDPGAEVSLQELFELIESIDEPYRDVFALRGWVGLEFSQIAARYGKTESWARVTYHRARIKLRQLL